LWGRFGAAERAKPVQIPGFEPCLRPADAGVSNWNDPAQRDAVTPSRQQHDETATVWCATKNPPRWHKNRLS